MKILFSMFVAVVTLVAANVAEAGRADHFRGWYEILSRQDSSFRKEYFLLDADTLGNIWAKYADGPLPPDLEQYRNEPSILAGFTNRDLLFLTLERSALIGNTYLALRGADGQQLEVRKRNDGNTDMATRDKGLNSLYLLGPAKDSPEEGAYAAPVVNRRYKLVVRPNL